MYKSLESSDSHENVYVPVCVGTNVALTTNE